MLRGTGVFSAIGLLCGATLFASCAGGGGGGSTSAGGGSNSGNGGGSGSATPSAPSGFSLSADNSSLDLGWTEISGLSYKLYWSHSSGVNASSTSVSGIVSGDSLSGLINSIPIYAAIAATSNGLESALSSEVNATPDPTKSGANATYDPSWANVTPLNTIAFTYNSALSQTQNGANLKSTIASLQPGDRLEIGDGTYSINSFFNITVSGTSSAPIWIAAKSGETPIITRPDAGQNAVNVGSGSNVSYLVLDGLEITGGSMGMRLYQCSYIWVNRCHIHDTAEAGITTNTNNTDHITITRNTIHDTLGTGEGMYLGANNGAVVMHSSTIALNHVYNTGGSQGDGIELKQGSYGNLIAENWVHDCNYPCILVYGTGGAPVNIVEKNVCYNSGDNTMQVQGEAIVRNNLVMNGLQAFDSHDHQGTVTNLQLIHNTFINSGRAVNLQNWSGKTGMVFANNVAYSQSSNSVRFSSGSSGVTIAGNVVYGSVSGFSSGYTSGSGLSDFDSASWDATTRNARPSSTSAILGTGNNLYATSTELTGKIRTDTLEAGCLDYP